MDRTEGGTKNGTEDSGRNRATQPLVDLREKVREGCSVVSGEGPPDTADGEKGAKDTDQYGQEEYKQKTECGTLASSRLRIDHRERKGAIARDNGGQIGDPIEDGDGVEEGSQSTKSDLGSDSSRHISRWIR